MNHTSTKDDILLALDQVLIVTKGLLLKTRANF
jgi:hypothetical protein